MQIISHRGYWKKPAEKNKRIAFERSFHLGYGTETDIRDHNRKLVIAHDMATAKDMPLDTFFAIYKVANKNMPLALNIKADGLAVKLRESLEKHAIRNYFLFDMSIPDMRMCLKEKLKTYARVSDVELEPWYYKQAAGIWFDAFHSDWYKPSHIRRYLKDGKPVCLVSPDLHHRPHAPVWKKLKDDGLHHEKNFTLCTDLPEDASSYFGITPR
jgi:glycerophosphoryl diester phosphodiesterase